MTLRDRSDFRPAMVVLVIGDSKDVEGEIQFLVHTTSDLEHGENLTPAEILGKQLLKTFGELRDR
jgi:hypothetical protein